MQHIRQKNSVNTESYTVVITDGYGGVNEPPLTDHPSIVEHPELFEISSDEIPQSHQFLNYVS
jgi:hypothetical protein